jgi:hypothetical protein
VDIARSFNHIHTVHSSVAFRRYDVEFRKHARICVKKINKHLPTVYRHSELPALIKFAIEMVVPAPFKRYISIVTIPDLGSQKKRNKFFAYFVRKVGMCNILSCVDVWPQRG